MQILHISLFIPKHMELSSIGMVEQNNASGTLEEALNDESRISYHRNYLLYVLNAIRYIVQLPFLCSYTSRS